MVKIKGITGDIVGANQKLTGSTLAYAAGA